MILAICIDDSCGMMFNNRRLSADKAVVQDLLRLADPNCIAIAPYSLPLFSNYEDRIVIHEDVLNTDQSFCFAEFGDFLKAINRINALIVYKWNRRYPSDTRFPLEAFTARMTLKSTDEFTGTSHPFITREVYVR